MAHDMGRFSTLELKPAGRITSTASPAGLDISKYTGQIKVVASIVGVSGTDPTNTMKLMDSATVDGTYADVVGGAFDEVEDGVLFAEIDLDSRLLNKFLRVTETIGGTDTPTFDTCAILVGRKQVGG